VEVVGLLTTVNQVHDRVAMHAVRRSLLEEQAAAVGLPLWPVDIPSPCTNDEYAAAMTRVMDTAHADGIEGIAFGDLFLEDVRAYREEQMAKTGIMPLFPIWGFPTADLPVEMITAGLKAHLTCVDPRSLDRDFVGRDFNQNLLDDLPDTVDPCGENGEYHTFVYDGPMFDRAISVVPGRRVEREGFMFADLNSER